MSYAAVLKHRDFKNLLIGQAISQVGDAFYYLIFMFMVKEITGSNAMVGFVGAAETIPFLLLGPYAGVLADRLDRKKLMLWSDMASFGLLALYAITLTISPQPPVWTLLAIPCLLSIIRTFFLPAKGASVPRLVPPEDVQSANALSMTVQTMMPLLGLALTGSALGAIYLASPNLFFTIAVALNALSFLVSAIYIRRLPAITPLQEEEPKHPLADLVEGVRYIRKRHVLLVLIILSGGINLFAAPFYVFYVAANKQWFSGSPIQLAWIEFFFFVGMLIGSVAVGSKNIRRPGLAYALSLAFVGVLVAAMGFAPWVIAFMALNFICGIALPYAQIPTATYLQLTVDDAFRGRVNSALAMLASGMAPIGYALAGIMLDRTGLRDGFLVMGFGIIAVSLIGFLDRAFRTAETPYVTTTVEAQDEPKSP